jgi:hypothetical protein
MSQEWGSDPIDFLGDPRKNFVALLIWDIKIIQTQIYLERKPLRAVSSLMGLIDTLDADSKKKLENQYKKLDDIFHNALLATTEDIQKLFRQILSFLHTTYLRETHFAKPMRPSKGFPGVPEF